MALGEVVRLLSMMSVTDVMSARRLRLRSGGMAGTAALTNRAVLIAALLCPVAASATLIQRFEIEDLAVRSAVVAVVRVVSVEARWEEDSMIRTRVRLEAERTIVGDVPREMTVVVAGGSVDGASATMGGSARFTVGEQMVVFLEPRGRGGMHVVGAFQGAFRLVTERATGMLIAERDAAIGAALVGLDGSVLEDAGARSLYLDELEARVKRAVR